MTTTDELVLAKLSSDEILRSMFHPSELRYLIDLVTKDVRSKYGMFS